MVGYTGYRTMEAKTWLQEKLQQGADYFKDATDTLSLFIPKAKISSDVPDVSLVGELAAAPQDPNRERPEERPESSKEYGALIRKMIEVRDVLQAAGLEDRLGAMPAIVVIGSQSSGKSSVLECLVGHEFLPKGHNMVTRRPLELTLVYEPESTEDYAVLAGGVKLTNFEQVRRRIAELNEAVPKDDWVCAEPVKLEIHSAHVPDLTLIDLPGYIQVTNKNQPPVLRDKISQLCDAYITKNNIILAVSAADVDLANSESLKASRRVDPLGARTIGVITKLDLVEHAYAEQLLHNETSEYPLRLGYIGVICNRKIKIPETFDKEHFGFDSLQRKLTAALEKSLAASLSSIMATVRDELKESRYQLKVHYNDHCTDEDTFLRDFSSAVKSRFSHVADAHPREKIRALVRAAIEKVLLDVYERNLWREESAGFDDLQVAISCLTRYGIGKLGCEVIVASVSRELRSSLAQQLKGNPETTDKILKEVEKKIHSAMIAAVDQIENAIKPLKSKDDVLEWEVLEWKRAFRNTNRLLQDELAKCSLDVEEIERRVGRSKLQKAAEAALNDRNILPELTTSIDRVVHLRKRQRTLSARLQQITNSNCNVPEAVSQQGIFSRLFSWNRPVANLEYEALGEGAEDLLIRRDPCQDKCPEAFLYLVAERLIAAATMYGHEDLVKGLEYASSSAISLSLPTPVELSRENAAVWRQVQLCRRISALEKVKVLVAYLEQRHSQL